MSLGHRIYEIRSERMETIWKTKKIIYRLMLFTFNLLQSRLVFNPYNISSVPTTFGSTPFQDIFEHLVLFRIRLEKNVGRNCRYFHFWRFVTSLITNFQKFPSILCKKISGILFSIFFLILWQQCLQHICLPRGSFSNRRGVIDSNVNLTCTREIGSYISR